VVEAAVAVPVVAAVAVPVVAAVAEAGGRHEKIQNFNS
jgi:hypothetical protein